MPYLARSLLFFLTSQNKTIHNRTKLYSKKESMDYFEVTVRSTAYLIKPHIEEDSLFFTTEVEGKEVLFGGTGNGLEAIDPPDVEQELLEEIASEIDSYLA